MNTEPIADDTDVADVDVAASKWTSRGGAATPLGNLSGVDAVVLGALIYIPCAYVPVLSNWFWSARMIALLAIAPAGVWALLRLVRSGDAAARWAAGALGWSVAAALFSGNISASLRGWVGQDHSVLSFAAVFALWALARFMSEDGKRLVGPSFLVAAGVNLAVGSLQVIAQVENGDLALLYGRAIGLTPNPVFFGAVMAGAAALCAATAARADTARTWIWNVGVFGFAVGVAFSGSRVALGATVLLLLFGIARFVTTRAVFTAVIAAVGLAGGSVFARLVGQDNDSISRLAQGGSDGRFAYWRVASEAVVERPVFGWGLGRFRFATQGRFSLEQSIGFDSSQPFFDAHNVVLALAVAVGIPGLILFAGFAWTASRSVRPVVAPAVAAIVVTWMLQPAALTTLPVVMILLGAARGDADGTLFGSTMRAKWATSAVVLVGVIPAAWLGTAEYKLLHALESPDVTSTQGVADLYLDDPVVFGALASQAELFGSFDPDARILMFESFEKAAELDPGRPHWWIELARRQGAYGEPADAKASIEQALDVDPFNAQAWAIMRLVGRDLDDPALELEAVTMLCDLQVPDACDGLADFRTEQLSDAGVADE